MHERNLAIRAKRCAGSSIKQLALEYGLGERHVATLCKGSVCLVEHRGGGNNGAGRAARTKVQVDKWARMAAKGLPASEIARREGAGVTRCAVLGALHRRRMKIK